MSANRKPIRVNFHADSRHRHLSACYLIIGLALLLPGTSSAQSFTHGATNFSVLVANGRAFAQDYTIVGIGVGYYVANGLELGLELESWTGGDPNIYKVTPSFRYVLRLSRQLNPYIGAFYRRVYINGYPDLDSWGARAGAFIETGEHSYMGIGVVYTQLRDCNQQLYQTCSDSYPELTLGFSI